MDRPIKTLAELAAQFCCLTECKFVLWGFMNMRKEQNWIKRYYMSHVVPTYINGLLNRQNIFIDSMETTLSLVENGGK